MEPKLKPLAQKPRGITTPTLRPTVLIFDWPQQPSFSIWLPCIGLHRPEPQTFAEKSRKCNQTDGEPGTFSGLAHELQKPVGLTYLTAEIPTALPTHVEPS